MVQYASQEYFDALASALNADPAFQQKTANVKADLLFLTKERPDGFLLKVDHGKASVQNVPADAPADFTFTADLPTWISNHRDGVTLEKLIMTGKVKFKGSLPRIMTLKNQLTIIDQKAKTIPAEY